MNDEAGGRRRWYVPDAYLPGDSSHGVESHESACLLNTGSQPAVVSLTFFFEDRDPVGPGGGDGRLAAHAPRPADGSRPVVRASSCRATSRSPTRPSATFRSSSSTRGSTRLQAPTPSARRSRMASNPLEHPEIVALVERSRRLGVGSARHELRRRQHLGQGRARGPDHRRAAQRARGEGLRRRPRHADRRRARARRPRAAARAGARLRRASTTRTTWSACSTTPASGRAARCRRSTRPCTDFSPLDHVDHLHPDALIAFATAADGRERVADAFGGRLGWLDWQRPGFDLGLAPARPRRRAARARRRRARRPRRDLVGRHVRRVARRSRSR